MKQKIYACFDVDASEYGSLVLQKNDKVAIRNYLFGLSQRNVSPVDFDLYQLHCLGIFDTETGAFSDTGKHDLHVPVSAYRSPPQSPASNRPDKDDLA